MNRPKPAHITIDGTPLCRCEGHHGGIINAIGVTCGYRSIADARRAKLEIQKHRHSVRVVPGHCPAS